jgi:hypothetical protein
MTSEEARLELEGTARRKEKGGGRRADEVGEREEGDMREEKQWQVGTGMWNLVSRKS